MICIWGFLIDASTIYHCELFKVHQFTSSLNCHWSFTILFFANVYAECNDSKYYLEYVIFPNNSPPPPKKKIGIHRELLN